MKIMVLELVRLGIGRLIRKTNSAPICPDTPMMKGPESPMHPKFCDCKDAQHGMFQRILILSQTVLSLGKL